MLLEFIGIIGAAIVAIVTIGMVTAGASVVLLSLAGLIKGIIATSKGDVMVTDSRATAFNHAA